MLETCLAFDPNYGICRVYYCESLGGWRQILNDGSHVSVTESEMKHFRLFPYLRSAYWMSERNLVDLLLEQLHLSGIDNVYSEMMTAVNSLRCAVCVSKDLETVKIGLEISTQGQDIILKIWRMVDEGTTAYTNDFKLRFADVFSLEYDIRTLVKALEVMGINYKFKQLSGKDIFDINNL